MLRFFLSPTLLSFFSSLFICLAHLGATYVENADELLVGDLIPTLLEIIVVVSVATILGRLLLWKLVTAVPVGFFLFFLYRQLDSMITTEVQITGLLTLAILSGLFLLVCIIFFAYRYNELHKPVFLFSLVFIFGNALIPFLLSGQTSEASVDESMQELLKYRRTSISTELGHAIAKERSQNLPDIIYIIPDRYGNSKALSSVFDWDNSDFYTQLRERGFVVNDNSFANYPSTHASISSSFNAQYLQDFFPVLQKTPKSIVPLYRLMEQNWAQETLRKIGYRYEHYGYWWPATKTNRFADRNFTTEYLAASGRNLSRLSFIFWDETPAVDVMNRLGLLGKLSTCDYVKAKIKALKHWDHTGPTFKFVHLEIPHDPFLLNKDGSCRDRKNDGDDWNTRKAVYIEYLRYFNKLAIELFDAHSDQQREFIFVIQSDEGPFPYEMYVNDKYWEMNRSSWETKLGNINAVYSSVDLSIDEHSIRTPINNWVYLLNHLTGDQISTKEHHVYMHRQAVKGKHEGYVFEELMGLE